MPDLSRPYGRASPESVEDQPISHGLNHTGPQSPRKPSPPVDARPLSTSDRNIIYDYHERPSPPVHAQPRPGSKNVIYNYHERPSPPVDARSLSTSDRNIIYNYHERPSPPIDAQPRPGSRNVIYNYHERPSPPVDAQPRPGNVIYNYHERPSPPVDAQPRPGSRNVIYNYHERPSPPVDAQPRPGSRNVIYNYHESTYTPVSNHTGRQSLRSPSAPVHAQPPPNPTGNVIHNYNAPVYHFYGPTANVPGGQDPPTIRMMLPRDAGEGYSYLVDFPGKQDPNSSSTRVHSSQATAPPPENQAPPSKPAQATGMVNASHGPPPNPDDYFTGISDKQGSQNYKSSTTMHVPENRPRQSPPAPAAHHNRNDKTHTSPFRFASPLSRVGSRTARFGPRTPPKDAASSQNVEGSPKSQPRVFAPSPRHPTPPSFMETLNQSAEAHGQPASATPHSSPRRSPRTQRDPSSRSRDEDPATEEEEEEEEESKEQMEEKISAILSGPEFEHLKNLNIVEPKMPLSDFDALVYLRHSSRAETAIINLNESFAIAPSISAQWRYLAKYKVHAPALRELQITTLVDPRPLLNALETPGLRSLKVEFVQPPDHCGTGVQPEH